MLLLIARVLEYIEIRQNKLNEIHIYTGCSQCQRIFFTHIYIFVTAVVSNYRTNERT